MPSRSLVVLMLSVTGFLRDGRVSCCDESCTNKPVFTPPSLVVRFGDSTSANCSVCEDACVRNQYDVESPVGRMTKIGSTVVWTVDALTEWSPSSLCYYSNDAGQQCCTYLPVTVYKPPHKVSVSVNHRGPMMEGHQYTLQCTVEDVAPVKNLFVTFYRGQTALGQPQSIISTDEEPEKPVTQNFTLDINPGREDDGAEFWCEAKLELGPEGPKLPPVETSQKITATVHYKPHLEASSPTDPIKVQEGELLRLNCPAVANPPPLYTWTHGLKSIEVSEDVLAINSTTVSDGGKYTCSVVNKMGKVTREFDVEVQASYIVPIIVVVVLLIAILGLVAYFYWYKQGRVGRYNLKDVCFRSHSAVPTAE
ncbi:vascular cell adhesion protein 1-like [Pungitius pungitius]|uniref:vascular cell adhesion protein 1-like n=1 Tax=Pungitius pungitius TaxID=134920 RepID=UPI002E130494